MGIQLRSAAELGAALRLLARDEALDYVLVDGTFALPFIGRRSTSLFYERLKRGRDEEETRAHERRLFEDLDYTGHDRRCYGYPYPIKAGHDRASLTQAERVALRKMIVDAAVRAGLKRNLFRDAAQATGHG